MSRLISSLQGCAISVIYFFMNTEVKFAMKKRWSKWSSKHITKTRRRTYSSSSMGNILEKNLVNETDQIHGTGLGKERGTVYRQSEFSGTVG